MSRRFRSEDKSKGWMRKLGISESAMFKGQPDDCIILFMGPTGVGKSTFIKEYTNNVDVRVGHTLESCTRHVAFYPASPPQSVNIGRHRLILVDTPGFDDTFSDDSDILKKVAAWLAEAYNSQAPIAGIVYMNDITQKRRLGSTSTNLKMFSQLCGMNSYRNVVLAASQWDLLPGLRVGMQREKELTETFSDIIKAGATIKAIRQKPHDQEAIITLLLRTYLEQENEKQVSRIQKEIVHTQGRQGPKKEGTSNSRPPSFTGKTGDVVILVMGPTGAGKSTFIQTYTGNKDVKVGASLDSCTSKVAPYSARIPQPFVRNFPSGRLVLVDTPGFDDSNGADAAILVQVSEWLAGCYVCRTIIAGIVYVHDISQKRMFPSSQKCLDIFSEICGKRCFQRMVFISSQWDTLKPEARPDAITRETQLKTKQKWWGKFIDEGAEVMRIENNTKEEATEVVGCLIQRYLNHQEEYREGLAIQQDIVDLQRELPDTDAGKELGITLAGVKELLEGDQQLGFVKKAREFLEVLLRMSSKWARTIAGVISHLRRLLGL